ncbi:hypothetical protein MMC29_000966 [Sticta canariensis]|nr:hypothetical protein [Sticta canariensis]
MKLTTPRSAHVVAQAGDACQASTASDQMDNAPFSYDQNTTFCQDGTVCPNTGNTTCCRAGAGKKEILFHYISPLPTIVKDLTSFYSLAGYSLPSSTTSSSGATVSTSPTSTASASASSLSRPESSSPQQFSSPSSSSNPKPNSADPGLSSSAKAGIGIGVSLGALLVGLAILVLRRRRRRNMPADLLDPPPPASHWPGSIAAGELPGKSVPAEINGSGRKPAEMYGDPTSAELLARSSGVRYEL